MKVPETQVGAGKWTNARRACGLLLVLGTALGQGRAFAVEKQTPPSVKLALDKLGFPGVSQAFLTAGSSMLTVHFLDSQHLLVTFGSKTLVPRVPGDPETHDDRMVAAEVVEVPQGKIVARTEWHMHDHGRYLWSLGQGRFMVRIGDALHAIAPLANLETKEPFRLMPFPHSRVNPRFVTVSADAGMVTVESELPPPPKRTIQIVNGDPDAPGDKPQVRLAVEFYRISGAGSEASPLSVVHAGSVVSRGQFAVPLDADGYLWATNKNRGRWALTFDGFGSGKSVEVGQLMSSCVPRLQLVSKSQFLAMSCRGSEDKLLLAAFGFDGHETWEEPFGTLQEISFVPAAAAGRFAVSKISTNVSGSIGATGLPPPPTDKQEVRVYQTESGDLLLRVVCTPIFKTAENFDFAADGRMLAVVHEGAIVIYTLPAPSKRDLQDLAEVQKLAPPASDGAVKLARITHPITAAENESLEATTAAPSAAASAATVPVPAAAAPSAAAAGASGGTDKRAEAQAAKSSESAVAAAEPAFKPPTLLNPGEKAEFQDKKPKPR